MLAGDVSEYWRFQHGSNKPQAASLCSSGGLPFRVESRLHIAITHLSLVRAPRSSHRKKTECGRRGLLHEANPKLAFLQQPGQLQLATKASMRCAVGQTVEKHHLASRIQRQLKLKSAADACKCVVRSGRTLFGSSAKVSRTRPDLSQGFTHMPHVPSLRLRQKLPLPSVAIPVAKAVSDLEQGRRVDQAGLLVASRSHQFF